MTPHPRWLLGLLCCLPTAGCCSIAQGLTALFCGPRDDPWPTVSYRTPEEALRTFQEAVARDDAAIIYKSLSEDLKRRWQIGKVEALLAWPKIKEQQPGIHTIGLARIVKTPIQQPTVVEYEIEVAFHRFRVRLKRHNYWNVLVAGEEGPVPHGEYVRTLSPTILQIRDGADTSAVQIRIREVEIPRLRLDDVIEITVGREWKVDAFGPVPET